jgi:hypothetical protein
MTRMRTYATVLVSVSLAFLMVSQGTSQNNAQTSVANDEEETFSRFIDSPEAEFYSAPGFRAPTPMSRIKPVFDMLRSLVSRSSVSTSSDEVPGSRSSRFEVLVNDPNQDQLASSLDITTQSETAVAGYGDTIVVAFNDSGETVLTPAGSFMGYSRSTDGGANFTDLGMVPPFSSSPAQFNDGDPALVVDRSGNFYLAHIGSDATRPTGFTNVIGIHKSTDGGQTWGPPMYPAAGGVLPNSSQDKDFLTVDNSGGPFDGSVYVTWTSFQPSPLPPGAISQLPIFFSRSSGGDFSTPIQISPPGHQNQGSEPAVGPNGEIYVTWFRISGPPPAPGQPPLGRAIMVAKSTDGGASFSPAVEVVSPVVPIGFGGLATNGRLFGNFRVNSFPRIDVNPVNGDVYIVYAANPAGPDGADIFFTRSTDGGATWSSPLRVNNDATNNDQFFPDIAVNAQGIIEVAWYDRRLDPQNLRIDVVKARSINGGLSFLSNQRVTSVSSFPAVGFDPIVNTTYMGDYIDLKAITTPSGRGLQFLLSWGDFRRVVVTSGGTRPDQDVFFTSSR